METRYLSKRRYDEIEKELSDLKNRGRKEVASRLRQAKELGDLSENSEYIEARRDQELLEQRINQLEEIIRNSEIIKDLSRKNQKTVTLGSTVTLKRDGKKTEYKIVGSNESDPLRGMISNESPLGSKLLGKSKGDKLEVETPKGKAVYQIVKIS